MALQMLSNALAAVRADFKEIGRPLTLRIHEGKSTSLLDKAYDPESGSKVNMKGVLNLVVILLFLTNLRNIMLSYKRNGFTLN